MKSWGYNRPRLEYVLLFNKGKKAGETIPAPQKKHLGETTKREEEEEEKIRVKLQALKSRPLE